MKVLLLCGEPSGDRMGAGIARALRRLVPGVEIRAMGSRSLQEAGVPLVVDATRLAVVGISEVLAMLPELLRARARLRREIAEWRPDVLVPVDYPDFNVRIARWAKDRGTRVAWIVSPQVWAWRPGRVASFARAVSRMVVLFPFEVDTWRRAAVDVELAGHPLLDMPEPPSREQARRALGIEPDARAIALLPGSRRRELLRTWPVMAGAASRLAARAPLSVVVPRAPGLDAALLDERLAAPARVTITEGRMHDAVAACDVAAVASGTATLETALVPRAMVVGYRVSAATMALSRWLADAEFLARGTYCLPNLVLGRAVVPELYQERFTVDAVEAALAPLLDDAAARHAMERELLALRPALGGPGALDRMAASIADVARSRG